MDTSCECTCHLFKPTGTVCHSHGMVIYHYKYIFDTVYIICNPWCVTKLMDECVNVSQFISKVLQNVLLAPSKSHGCVIFFYSVTVIACILSVIFVTHYDMVQGIWSFGHTLIQ